LSGAVAGGDTGSPPAADEGVSRTADAAVDIDRRRRCGFPEAVFGEGKSPGSVAEIVTALRRAKQDAFVTRATAAQAAAVRETWPDAAYDETARTIRVMDGDGPPDRGHVAVVTAGTTDGPVAAEVVETLRWMRVGVERFDDVGVAGPQRLTQVVPRLRGADAVVVVAGMEGALPSVVGGHVACPIFAVPTSVGYGASLGGVAALLSMLNSCAANVAVVNIDAGFKAAFLAGLCASRQCVRANEARE
ncbi:MAG: nickel pincer cofactor biosynthesis protein LarB, partial [Planctomycetota bacterium]